MWLAYIERKTFEYFDVMNYYNYMSFRDNYKMFGCNLRFYWQNHGYLLARLKNGFILKTSLIGFIPESVMHAGLS